MDYAMIYKKISTAEVISFDIFDTLIVRLYRKPTDLFLHLETSTGNSGFKDARISAEQNARKEAFSKDVHEVTLKQIYQQMHPSYAIMLEKEIELERRACKANPEMMKVYQAALQHGKRIFISSDMYLPKNVVEEILQNAGYAGYEKLILSSETMRPKYTMEMYEDLLLASGVQAKKILHIGDNYETDYENAKKSGICAYHYERIQETVGDNRNSAYFALLNKYADREVAPSILKGMITLDEARNPDKSFWESFAYKYAGLLMVGYCQWLKQQFDREGIRKAYFMLRDGYIVKRIFNQLYPDFETEEIYGSRRMYLFARMTKYEDIKEYITSLAEGVTYRMLYDRLLIDKPELYIDYCKAFPNQDDDLKEADEIHLFMKRNEQWLLEVAEQESMVLAEYIASIYEPGEKCAIVDLGWRCSMLKGIQAVCNKAKIRHCFFGYYLGTHRFNGKDLRVTSFGLNNGLPDDQISVFSNMNSLYVIDILELIFSAPHNSVLKLNKQGKRFVPVMQDNTVHEQQRIHISEIFLREIKRFTEDYMAFTKEYPIPISAEAALLATEYFNRHISPADQREIAKVFVLPGLGNDSTCFPLTPHGRGRVALINPWVDVCGAESEALLRIRATFRSLGFDVVITDQQGMLLDDLQHPTCVRYEGKMLDFAITFNYETSKLLDCFYYHAVWSPPEMALRLDYFVDRASKNLLMNDDYLLYWDGTLKSHIESLCINKPRNLENPSELVASFPKKVMMTPNLDDPKMFYCGMNWEKADGTAVRHEGLFKLLDETGNVKFFGPDIMSSWGGIRPWEGYKCYQYPIPFDGFSILKEINECGICLVLSSDIHRRAGAVTNRLYEACAAGAVIISDDNEFTLKYFKDAALFIAYNRFNPRDTFTQIMEKYDWIVTHKDDALKLVRKAQKIFNEKFALDVQLRRLVEHHAERFDTIRQDLFATPPFKKVLVTYVLNSINLSQIEEFLDPVIENVQNQIYPNMELAIATDHRICYDVREHCRKTCANAKVVPMKIFDAAGAKIMTDGQAIRILQKNSIHEYYVNTSAREVWFYDHITTLIRTIEDNNAIGAYSGTLEESAGKIRTQHFFDVLTRVNLYDRIENSEQFPYPGQFLFQSNAHEFVPDCLFDCLDGKEHYAYCNLLLFKQKRKLSFSRRMTLVFRKYGTERRNLVLDDMKQSRFIKDLVKFDLPYGATEVTVAASSVPSIDETISTKQLIANMIAILPIRCWFLLRYYRFMMRKFKPDSPKNDKYKQKYEAIWNAYTKYWGK